MSFTQNLKSELSQIKDGQLIVDSVRRWGGSASEAILDPYCQIFSTPKIEGIIGYRVNAKCAVVYGNPVCERSKAPLLAQEFHNYCKSQNWNVAYLMTSKDFADWVTQEKKGVSLEYGKELFLDPSCNDPREKTGSHASLVRRKVRHALNTGVVVKEYKKSDLSIEKNLENVAQEWLKSRKGPQVYISHIHLFSNRPGKRWFYAQLDDRIIGVVLLNELKARQGWLLNRLMFTPNSPGGTPELLVISAIEALKKEGFRYLTFGAVPDANLGKIVGLGTFANWFARCVYKTANNVLRFSGHKMFWEKFNPESETSYLLFMQQRIGLTDLWALMHALNMK